MSIEEGEIVLETVRELLPEIEQSLRQQMHQELREEFQQKFQIEIEQHHSNFDIEMIKKQVDDELKEQYEQQKQDLEEQIVREFDEQISNGQMEQQLKQRVQQENEETICNEISKRQKQVKLQFKKKLEQDKQQLLKALELEWKQKVEQEKKQLERDRAELARLKSLKYVKLKKIQDEKKKSVSNQKEIEIKHQEKVNQLQKQIQDLTCEVENLLQKKITLESEQQKQQESRCTQISYKEPSYSVDLPLQIKPIYQHKLMTEIDQSYVVEKITDKSLQRVEQKSQVQLQGKANSTQQQYSKYEQELQKARREQCLKHNKSEDTIRQIKKSGNYQNKENNQKKINKLDKVFQQKDSTTPSITENEKFDILFQDSDLDNTKNKQMKYLRKKIKKDQINDYKLHTKYIGVYINISNDLIEDYVDSPNYEEVKYLIQELIEKWNQWRITYQYRIDFLKLLKHEISKNFDEVIPVIQQEIHKFKLIHNYQTQFRMFFQLKDKLISTFTSYTQSKQFYEQLINISKNLDQIKLNVDGSDFQDQLKLILWENDYLEREELKSQLLNKIQSKLL